mmetsp:Transcript_39866/g.85042  ORF Transcript_39866/g.85042 Transcript_39866/m.85042 type:complete len:216 (+) Transcript_39866:231-878(+)
MSERRAAQLRALRLVGVEALEVSGTRSTVASTPIWPRSFLAACPTPASAQMCGRQERRVGSYATPCALLAVRCGACCWLSSNSRVMQPRKRWLLLLLRMVSRTVRQRVSCAPLLKRRHSCRCAWHTTMRATSETIPCWAVSTGFHGTSTSTWRLPFFRHCGSISVRHWPAQDRLRLWGRMFLTPASEHQHTPNRTQGCCCARLAGSWYLQLSLVA